MARICATSSPETMAKISPFGLPCWVFPVMSRSKSQNCGNDTQPRRPSTSLKTTAQKTVILMRHGMTDWNQEGRVQGGLDKSRLNNRGSNQARHAGMYLRNIPIGTILCSPLRRAKDTFELLAESSANPDLLAKKPDFRSELIEFQIPWQGTLLKELETGPFKQDYSEYRRNPMRFSYYGFNPIRDLTRRAQRIWEAIACGQASSYLVISHNQTNKALIATALQIPTDLSTWNQSNCCFNIFLLADGKPARLRLCNGTDLANSKTISGLVPPKSGFLRLVLHHEGHVDGLLHETSEETISHICCIGKSPRERFGVAATYAKVESFSMAILPTKQTHEDIYFTCLDVLDSIRRQHKDGYIIVSAENAIAHSALVAVCLGMGPEGIARFHSDPGGVSIIDVESSVEVGSGSVVVQCYNNYAYRDDSGGFLRGYTHSV